MNALEKILAYWNVAPYLSQENQNDLLTKLELSKEDLSRLWGKENEETFFLILYQSEEVQNIFLLNESFSKLTKTNSPDAIITLHNGKSFLIDVKSSRKDSIKIKSSIAERQLKISKSLNIPLLYAVYNNELWGIYDTEDLKSKGYTITHPLDLELSLLDDILDFRYIILPEGLKTILYHSSEVTNHPYNEEFGGLIKLSVEYNGTTYTFPTLDHDQFHLYQFAFTAINNALLRQDKIKIVKNGTITIIQSEAIKDIIIPEYNVLLAPIFQTINNNTGKLFNASDFVKFLLEQFPSHRNSIFKARKQSIKLIEKLIKHKIPIRILKLSELINAS